MEVPVFFPSRSVREVRIAPSMASAGSGSSNARSRIRVGRNTDAGLFAAERSLCYG